MLQSYSPSDLPVLSDVRALTRRVPRKFVLRQAQDERVEGLSTNGVKGFERTGGGRRRGGRMLGLSLALLFGFGAGVEARVAPGHAQSAQVGTIAGTVVAREDGQAVAEAVVVIEGADLTAVTNAIGRFRIENVPPGDVVLIVQASGFLELRVPSLQIPPNETMPLTVELEVTPNFLERVQVTATKTSLSIGDVAASADTVDRATIDRRGDQVLTQAIAHVPGAIIATQLGLFESVLLRGMPRVGNEFTNTLLLIDGVPQTNSGNDARVVALTINDARSIEVVRGPNSALYGRTAIGGAINVLTADPTPDPQVGFEFTGGEFRDGERYLPRLGAPGAMGRVLRVGRERAQRRLLREQDNLRLRRGQLCVVRQVDVRARRAVLWRRQCQPRHLG